jgi:hypothetical protein
LISNPEKIPEFKISLMEEKVLLDLGKVQETVLVEVSASSKQRVEPIKCHGWTVTLFYLWFN